MSITYPTTLDEFLNPSQTTHLDAASADPRLDHALQHSNINDAVEALEAKLGVNFSSVNTSIDYIVDRLLMTQTEHGKGVRRDIIGGIFPTQVIWYSDLAATIKLVEKKYTYNSSKGITKIELFLYDGTIGNVVQRTITDNITLTSNIIETTRVRTVS